MRFICKDPGDPGSRETGISTDNQECSGGYLTYRFLLIHLVSGGRFSNCPCLNSCNTSAAFVVFEDSTCFGGIQLCFKICCSIVNLRLIARIYIQGKMHPRIVIAEDLVALRLLDSQELVEDLAEEWEPEVLVKQLAM